MRISLLGDISLNDNYIELYQKGVNPFEAVQRVLSGSDFVMGNLECIAKGEFGENEQKKPRLTTTVETLNYLNNLSLSVACLAQNHVYDHLEDGFSKTIEFLNGHEIQYIGAGLASEDASKPLILRLGEIAVGLLNYVTHDTNLNLPEDAGIYINMFNIEKCITEIKELRQQVDHIVLSLHWGGRVEGGMYPDWDQPGIAHELIDAGADLIIGHHSHTIQPYEIYKGKYIFYSLGNFCFSDYWFEDMFYPNPKRRMTSIIVNANFIQSSYSITMEFFHNRGDSFVKFDEFEKKIRARNRMFKILFISKIFWNIYYFHKRFILPVVLFFGRNDISLKVKVSRFFKYILKEIAN